MNFEEFCETVESVDGRTSQKVEITNTGEFVRFVQLATNKEFLIATTDILAFMAYARNHETEIEAAIIAEPRFNREKYTQYEEKGYRALFNYLEEQAIDSLRPVISLGLSQSAGVTQVIAKVICFSAGLNYEGAKENTFLDKESLDKALENIGNDICAFLSKKDKALNDKNLMSKFVSWLNNHPKEWSQKSIKKYSQDSIKKADEILNHQSSDHIAIYEIHDSKVITQYISQLDENSEWKQRNDTGNRIFSRGIELYKEFLEELEMEAPSHLDETVLPKPFLLLAGISGTGKTRFVRKQAKEHSMDGKNFCLVSVRPDWHEPSDLLGYISRIDGTKYVATKALKFIVEAWKAVAPNANKSGMGELDLSSAPYWLCLDEMNLAPVEQYFADYLSVLESREFNGGEYNCDALLDKAVLESVPDIQHELGLKDDTGLWEYFSEHGISLPPNLIVAGTVNMDETTHGFSRKVIDRAISIDFGKFYPNDYDTFFAGQALPKTLTYSTKTHADKAVLENTCDPEGDKTKTFLKNINEILNNTPFELAYRALNELFLFVSAFAPKDEETLQAVWDDFLMTKVLPRIDGDEDKLRSTKPGDNNNILDQLESFLSKELGSIWEKTRIDLLRSDKDGNDINNVGCRSKEKIKWMKDRLEKNTFTSYWP